jgi:hypothetical protein
VDSFHSIYTSVAFKSASAASSRLWQSGTIILDSAKTFSCRFKVQASVQCLEKLYDQIIRQLEKRPLSLSDIRLLYTG